MVHILEVPFEDRQIASKFGAVWHKGRGAWVYPGEVLPAYLREYLPKPYTWMEYQTQQGRGNLKPATSTGSITLRADQEENISDLLAAFKAGAPEVLIASKTGTGKTFVALNLAMRLPNSGKILIVCPKSVIPGWRKSIDDIGPQGKRFVIINYESLKKLIKPPAVTGRDATKAKTKAGERNRKRRINKAHASGGTPYVMWDVIIFDEAHYLSNFDAQRTQSAETLIASNPNVRVIRVSATIGSNPVKLGSLARGFAWRTGRPVPTSAADTEEWYEWCQSKGMAVEMKKWGKAVSLNWLKNDRDLKLINFLLFDGEPKWAVRADPGWKEPQRYQVPIELDKHEKAAYEEAWAEFQKTVRELDKLRKSGTQKISKRDVKSKGLAALTRYRQKVGQLKAPYIAEYIKEALEGDVQIAVSAEFMGTVDLLVEHLRGVDVALFTGRNEATREQERLAFQSGQKRVIIFTPSEGFNLHQGERGGNDVQRVQICAEPSWSPINGMQKEGRTNRDGRTAPILYPSAVDTIDYKVIKAQMDGFGNISKMMGDEDAAMQELNSLMGADMKELL